MVGAAQLTLPHGATRVAATSWFRGLTGTETDWFPTEIPLSKICERIPLIPLYSTAALFFMLKLRSAVRDIKDTPLTSGDHVHHVWREEAYAALNRSQALLWVLGLVVRGNEGYQFTCAHTNTRPHGSGIQ